MDQPESSPCVNCGDPTIEGKKEDGVTTWTCVSCGQVVLDGHEAAWRGCTQQSNQVRLFTDGKEIYAMIGQDPVQGAAGYGPTVPEALRDLADELDRCGAWIEVTDPDHPFNWTEPPTKIE